MSKYPVVPVKLCSCLKGVKPGELPAKLLRGIEGKGKLHHCAADAYEAMDATANAAGIDLSPTSQADTYRSLETQEYGFYQRYTDVQLVDGTWLILAPTNYLLTGVHEYLKSMGILFERNGIRSIGEQTVEAVYAWEDLRKGKTIGNKEIKSLYAYLGSESIQRGFKKFVGEPEEFYDYERLQKEGGLLADKDKPWFDTLSRLSDANRVYIRASLRRGQSLRGNPRIRVSTIHGAKGGEADHVLLLTDLSTQFTKEQEVNPDNVNRLLYVGLTRTRKSLHIVYPQDQYKAFRL